MLDIGATDGYFTFGCAAAFRRLGKPTEIIAFEPLGQTFEELKSSLENQPKDRVQTYFHNCFVGYGTKIWNDNA